MCRIISIVNMKGGVGKSTTAVNLGIGLAKQGKKVLLLDCDSQGSLTASLGFRKPSLLEPSIATVMASIIEEDEIQDPILHHREGVDLVPANETLKGVELALVNVMSRELILKEYVSGLRPDYDVLSAIPPQKIEETVHFSNFQPSNSAPPLENWQKSYQNGEYIRSAESGEEANYNMIDGLHNNRRKRKKGKKRRSVIKRLHEKQMEVVRRERKLPQQEQSWVMQEQEIERKPKK